MTMTTKKALNKGYIEDQGAGQMAIYTGRCEFYAYVTKLAVLDDGQIVLQHCDGYGGGQRFSVVKPDLDPVPKQERAWMWRSSFPIHTFRTTAEWGPDTLKG